MKNISVSFIIPYYCLSRQLLERCMNSLLGLEAWVDWEAWVIDDGTPDSQAGFWIQDYANPRIRYVYQSWGGLSVARNTGLRRATKAYVQFLDADDYLFRQPLLAALHMLGEMQPDVLSFDFVRVRSAVLSASPAISSKNCHVPVFVGSGVDFMAHHNIRVSACGYLIRREILGDLCFTPSLLHEDEDFTPLMLLRARRLVVTHWPVYAYYQRPDSIMQATDPVRLEKRFTDILFILQKHTQIVHRLSGLEAAALRRRNELYALAILYQLIRESPSAHFLSVFLKRMQDCGYYPLPTRNSPFVYKMARLVTRCPATVHVLACLFRFWKKCRKCCPCLSH